MAPARPGSYSAERKAPSTPSFPFAMPQLGCWSRSGALALCLACHQAPDNSADIALIPNTPGCPTCTIQSREVLVLSGPPSAMVEWPQSAAIDARGRLFLAQPNKHVPPAVFGANGQFIGFIGREGAGPGEFGLAAHITVDPFDSLWIADWAPARLSVVSPDLQVVRSFAIPPGVQSATLPAAGTVALAAVTFARRRAFAPLKVFDRRGNQVGIYGPAPTDPNHWDTQYRLAPDGSGGFWAVRLWGRLLILHVDSSGHERLFERTPPWFRGVTPGARTADDASSARAIWQEGGLLWIVFQVHAPTPNAAMDTVRPEGIPVAVPRNPDSMADTWVEVLDPNRLTLVASRRFDEVFSVPASPGRLVRVQETDTGLRISIVALELHR